MRKQTVLKQKAPNPLTGHGNTKQAINVLKSFVKNFLIWSLSSLFVWRVSPYLGKLHCTYTDSCGGGWIDTTPLVGLFFGYFFFTAFFTTVIGGNFKYIWLLVWILGPLILLNFFYGDQGLLRAVAVTTICGWFLGWGILKMKQSLKRKKV
ncbi:MAG TPA: hypothetical protein VJG67_03340 [Candidatus Paceibacterota bacterium]